jgi:hypothetical protein
VKQVGKRTDLQDVNLLNSGIGVSFFLLIIYAGHAFILRHKIKTEERAKNPDAEQILE